MQVICFLGGSIVHYFSNASGIYGNVGCETMHSGWDCGIELMDSGVYHCVCGFHGVTSRDVAGFHMDGEEVIIRCRGKCPGGGWHLESGYIMSGVSSV